MAALGAFFGNGNARAGVVKDAQRGFALLRKAVAKGCLPAKLPLAQCYLKVGPDG
jgi:TPR repeat protein